MLTDAIDDDDYHEFITTWKSEVAVERVEAIESETIVLSCGPTTAKWFFNGK